MQLKLDENLGRTHVDLLQKAGYATDFGVYDQGLSGWSDSALWKRICDEGRLFITLDVDFADIRRYKPGSHPGILLLRPQAEAVRQFFTFWNEP